MGEAVAVRFGDAFGQCEYALLELDEELLEKICEPAGYDGRSPSPHALSPPHGPHARAHALPRGRGRPLPRPHPVSSATIKGDPDDEACLCTPDRTFVLRLAESSNTHYLIPSQVSSEPAGGVLSIAASNGTYYEVKPSVPRLVKLRRTLAQHAYAGPNEPAAMEDDVENGADAGALAPTTEQLRATIQCGDEQLFEALRAMHAVQIDGRWRGLEITYRHNVTEALLNLITEHDWPAAEVPVGALLEQLSADFPDFTPQVGRHCLEAVCAHALPELGPAGLAPGLTAPLDPTKVAIFHAENMLREQPRWSKPDFVEGWKAVAPSDVELELSLLRVRRTRGAGEEQDSRLGRASRGCWARGRASWPRRADPFLALAPSPCPSARHCPRCALAARASRSRCRPLGRRRTRASSGCRRASCPPAQRRGSRASSA